MSPKGGQGSSNNVSVGVGNRPHVQLNAILDAAEAVVLRDGMGRLTLDAVAAQAGLSKAGLLHHLPSKDALIGAMVERNVTEWHDEFRAIYAKLVAAGETRPAVGTMMSTCLSGKVGWTEVERARNRVLIAALVHDEKQIEPMRRVMRDIEGLISVDRLPPGVGDAIHLAVHGLWFQWIFGMGDVSHARLAQIRGALSMLGGFDQVPVKEIDFTSGSGFGTGTGFGGVGTSKATRTKARSRATKQERNTIGRGAKLIVKAKASTTKNARSRSKAVQPKGSASLSAARGKRGVS